MTNKGFTPGGLTALRSTLEREATETAAPGLVALIDRNGQTETFVAGHRTIGGAPLARDSLFRITSMTKLVTAAATMMLVEAGKLRLDEPVDRWLPELANRRVLKHPDGPLDDTVPARRAITVEDLLTFRCGWGILFAPPTTPIVKAIADLRIVGFGPPDPTMPFTPDAWIARLGTLPLMSQPGEAWRYTTGADILGVLIARVCGQPLDVVYQERIFGPLGMKDTGFHVPAAKTPRLAGAYTAQGDKLTVFDDPDHSRYVAAPKFPEADAGLISCVDDLLSFSRMLLARGEHRGKRLLGEASVKAMTTNHLTAEQAAGGVPILAPGQGWGYVMSVMTGPSPFPLPPGVFGWSGGFGTSWYMDPAKGLTTLILTNRMFSSPEAPRAHKAFWTGTYAALA